MNGNDDSATDRATLAALQLARTATDQYRTTLEALDDEQLGAQSLLPGWTRQHVAAHVAYNARAMGRLVDWATTGVETPMYTSRAARDAEIEAGAVLPAAELRQLDHEASADLDAAWRATPDDVWQRTVRMAQGHEVALVDTLWLRTREVMLHAIDLDGDTRVGDLPVHALARILGEVLGGWRQRGEGDDLRIEVLGLDDLGLRGTEIAGFDTDGGWGNGGVRVAGPLPAVVGWVSGRTRDGLAAGADVTPPRWL